MRRHKRAGRHQADHVPRMLSLLEEDIAAWVMLAINLPERAIAERLVVRPR